MKTPRSPRSALLPAILPPVSLIIHTSSPGPRSSAPEKIAPQWQWHYRSLLALRDRLDRAHTEHASEAIAPSDEGGIDAADSAQNQLDRDLLWAELGSENDRLLEIDAALARIRGGTYGRCVATGKPISAARLRAIPWTRFCREAAEVNETRAQHAV
jgi:RNA polymerase-binding transcription factor DksA